VTQVGLDFNASAAAARQYPGVELGELPDDYLAWLRGRDNIRDPLRSALEREWTRRLNMAGDDVVSEAVASVAETLISAGYRSGEAPPSRPRRRRGGHGPRERGRIRTACLVAGTRGSRGLVKQPPARRRTEPSRAARERAA
jgi:hypothetical protein